MSESESVPAELLQRLQGGDQQAASDVFARYARRLIGLARSQLDTRIRRKVDPEDVVQSVFRSFFRRQKEEFTVKDEHHLWNLLALITARKCINIKVHFSREVRNAGREVSFDLNAGDSGPSWEALARGPGPAEAAVFTELIERAMTTLPERERQIVALGLEGKTMREISDAVDRAERTVRRVLHDFRQQLEKAVLDPSTLIPEPR